MRKLIGGRRLMTSMFIVDGDDVLLLHREGSSVMPDSWVGIGGHVEPEEAGNPARAALREVEEELRLPASALNRVRMRYVATRDTGDEVRRTFYFSAELADGVSRPQHCTEGTLRWIPLDTDTSDLSMPPTARLVFDHWIAQGRFDVALRFFSVDRDGQVRLTLEE